jgi:hypothetical protein
LLDRGGMTTRDNLIEALRTLCSKHGGYKAVADKAGVDDQSIYQILSGVKLPSGNPKGVGPTMQRKLDTAFPGWAEHAGGSGKDDRAQYEAWPFRKLQPAALRSISDQQLAAVEEVLAAALSGMQPPSDSEWAGVATRLAMAMDRELGKDVYSAFVLKVGEIVAEHRTERRGRRAKASAN